jgi:hypothetical protein
VGLHALPHEPQFEALVLVLTSQPLFKLPSQFWKFGSHVIPQAPLVQVPVPLVLLHTFAHVPQWSGSAFRLVSQPLAAFPSQSANPAAQVILQAPATQLGVPLALLQTLPQAPQLFALLPVLISQPLRADPSQLAKPAEQEIAQTPPAQLGVPLVALHAFPHVPQLLTLPFKLVSQPFPTLLSQLP